MLYTVQQVASKLNVSKVTIYNKVKLNEFKDKIVIKQGQAMITEDLLNLIKDTLKLTNSFNTNENTSTSGEAQEATEEPQSADDITIDDSVVNMNKELLNALLDQLKEKDKQIEELNERLKQEQELNKNNQVLQLRQPQDIKALEEHFQDLDTKLEEVKGNMIHRKEQQDQPKGFFSKIFNKK